MNRFTNSAALFLLLAASPVLQATDAGKTLVDSNCTSCHGDAMYTRENRRITTLGGLKKQVRRCELSLGLKWFDADINAATTYLNKNYYHFE
ncbi:MAG: cytochrome c [Gammaproteobacteria bacterium]|nr:cytochrome c [Gammaproteobacteria bacterium]